MSLAIDLHVDLINMPLPVTKALHPANALAADFSREKRTEPVSPMAHRLVAEVDTALEQQVLHVPQRKRIAEIQHDHHPDHLR